MSELIASGLASRGHQVQVVVARAAVQDARLRGVPVHVRPSPRTLLGLHRWADVVLHSNICLRQIWPAWLLRKPLIVVLHTHIGPSGLRHITASVKRLAIRRSVSVAVSESVAAAFPSVDHVIHNAYREDVYHLRVPPSRTGDLVFVGRLVSEKGVDLLLEAVSILGGEEDIAPLTVTIVGDGPERAHLEAQVLRLRLSGQVWFTGARRPAEVASILAGHRVLAVPSRCPETFGLVALEGLAMGCTPVVADEGGLPEAVGPFGITFRRGSSAALAEALRKALTDGSPGNGSGRDEFLGDHSTTAVIDRYVEVVQACDRRGTAGKDYLR